MEGEIENISDCLYNIVTDGRGILGFTTVPASLSSQTVYDKSQVDAMLRDNTSVFYTEGY